MTTVVATLSPGLARDVAAAADWLGLTHSELAIAALRSFVKGPLLDAANERTNERTNERKARSARRRRKSRFVKE